MKSLREINQPATLPEVRTLSAHLKHEPLIEEILLLEGFESELLPSVILFDKIHYGSLRLPKGEICVGVDDCLWQRSAINPFRCTQ